MPHILEPAGVGYYGYLGFLASVYGFPGFTGFQIMFIATDFFKGVLDGLLVARQDECS
ncbi:uncharacterized protein CLUP02_10391 [Colletotrichum lupini]|uniref:Uncharacterized protein n=6 Tax=Colletotrichum acutatum species complex TaxID=2707335 RepID=A0A9Q8SXF8_9PEZI|nr:uncharacterized protein CLUP02_10391 [Colletotrichum lupini]XP_060316038.1 uncharacterized protein CCOS01_06094 [Colletotrichum costaricense]XP_060385889.1 uncharacterized protein CTAM01_03651 [Colletotrichum tamarilloi]KAI3534476.1 hypothetical protein CSPX01_12093 [Colletotrichum filicis]KAK1465279.1 hypothetical protein CCUS01_07684 [Colletotrichum cuscutae]KAK1469208.1 hypothetical protein CMEL01_00975 [Colletotrichum melonis]KAK1506316.1 hypothetical protein CTAM01_03651 [Colletotrich